MFQGAALDRIVKGLVQLRSHPSLLAIGPVMDRVKTYTAVAPTVCPTMATNGEAIIFNPTFVQHLSQGQLRTLIVHEMLHVMNLHHLRDERFRDDPKRANLAMDHVVNHQIKKMQAWQDGFLEPFPDWCKWICDDKYQDAKQWSFENVYRDIPAQVQQQPEGPCQEGEGGGGDGEESEQSAGGGGGGEQGQDQGQGQSQGGSQGPDPQQGPGGSGGQQQRPEGLPDDMAPGEVWPAPPSMERQEEVQEVAEALSQGELIAKSWGQGGGTDWVTDVREELEDEVGDWEFLRQMLEQHYAGERTWTAPNVVFLDHGYLPARKKTSGTLHVVFDTSGSMSDEELRVCFNNTVHIVETLDVHTIKVAYVDSRIRMPSGTTWEEFDIRAGEEPTFKVTGRGGTDFDPIFWAIEEEAEDVTCLIYFTDGEAYCKVPPPSFPVIWASTYREVMGWGEWGPWGEYVEVRAKSISRPWWER